MRAILRGNAVFDIVFGLVLLAGTWDGLYGVLGLRGPDPAIYGQFAGTFAVALGYLLWLAPRDVRLVRAVSAASALANGLGALVAVAWLADKRLDMPAAHAVLLVLFGLGLAALAVAEAVIASRSIAMLLPHD